jgi:hypothetical protein
MASVRLTQLGCTARRGIDALRCSSRLAILILGLAVQLVSCSQILGASEYSTSTLEAEPIDQDAAAPDSQPAFLAAPMCVSCANEHCSDTLAACGADSGCSEALSTVQHLSEPLIASHDWMHIRAEAQWAVAKGQAALVEFANLFHCIQSACAAPCELGHDFSCAGRFDYERRDQTDIELRLLTVDDADGQSLSDISVRACATQADCPTPLGRAVSGQDGLVQLPIDFSRAPVGVSTSTVSFTGALLFESANPERFTPQLLQQTRPWRDQDFLALSIVGREREAVVAQMVERMPHDAGLVPVQMQVQDCNDRPAEGLKFEIWSVEATGFRKCERCRIAYLSADAIATDPVLDRTSTAGQAYAVVPEGELMVTVRDATADHLRSLMRPFTVSSGTFYDLNFYPASRDQLAQLPKLPR